MWILVVMLVSLNTGQPTVSSAEFSNLKACQKASEWVHKAGKAANFGIGTKCISKETGKIWPKE